VPRAIRLLRADEPRTPIHDTLILTSDQRRSQRASVVSNRGVAIELDLPTAAALRTDDVLALDSGDLVDVVAAAEPLVEVRADLPTLARIAWALGDRHVPVQIFTNRIRLHRDPALEMLIASIGGKTAFLDAPFEPEGGAYAVAHDAHDHHDHHHHHGDHDHHDHDHDK
jgi:urease accessory protein